MASYRYFEIRDELHQRRVGAGHDYDGRVYVYPRDDKERSNAQWKFVDLGNGYYHLVDRRHGKALIAGDVHDGEVYHQDPGGRPNAEWALRPTGSPGAYTIADRKHGKALVAGEAKDGRIQHQDPEGRPEAAWCLTLKARGDVGPAVAVRSEEIVTTAETWLGSLPDDRLIFDINVPGTHDSAAINHTIRTLHACQDKSITDQLRLGVRLLDVRLRFDRKESKIEISTCHGSIAGNKYQSFSSLWQECQEFLDRYPTEFVAMTLKVDDWMNVKDQADREAALNALEQEMHGGSKAGYATVPGVPKLGELRGKVYLLNRINDEPRFGPGIAWNDNETGALVAASRHRLFELYVQDNYDDPSQEEKLKHFIDALAHKSSGRLVINYASAVHGTKAAVGHGLVVSAVGAALSWIPPLFGLYINQHILRWFAQQPIGRRPPELGWALFDYAQKDCGIEGFPLRNCVDLYVASNFGYALPY